MNSLMPGSGFSEIVGGLVVLLFISFLFRVFGKGVKGPTLVLKKFAIDKEGRSGKFVLITGRASGIIAWFLTSLGLDIETSLLVRGRDIIFKSSSLSGQVYQVAPMSSIASTIS